MVDRNDHDDDYKKSKKYKNKSRKRKRDYDDDDEYKRRDRDEKRAPQKGAIERVLTPGQTANNLVKTVATGIIAGSTLLLMITYAISGENIAGASSYLPMVTAVASAVATACVWIFGRPKTEEANNTEFNQIKKELRRLNSELRHLETENTELEERLATVEMLESFEDKLAKRTLENQTHSKSDPKPTSSPKSALDSDIPTDTDESPQASSLHPRETE